MACVHENQRYFPVTGWSKHLLPTDRHGWSNPEGTKNLRKEDCVLPHAWVWTTAWAVDAKGADSEGWQYAVDFPSKSYSEKKSLNHFVRRR